jgi:type VI protein secretion system component VasF
MQEGQAKRSNVAGSRTGTIRNHPVWSSAVLAALIGAVATIIAAFISTHDPDPPPERSNLAAAFIDRWQGRRRGGTIKQRLTAQLSHFMTARKDLRLDRPTTKSRVGPAKTRFISRPSAAILCASMSALIEALAFQKARSA